MPPQSPEKKVEERFSVSNSSLTVAELLLRGIPECLLVMWALHVFTRTKIIPTKYLLLSLFQLILVYLVRFLPVALGVNSVLSLVIAVVIFQFAYQTQISGTIRTILAAAIALLLLAVSEALNMGLLILLYGYEETEQLLLYANSGWQRSLYSFPSILFLALFILLSQRILKKMDGKKAKHGETGETTGP